ncbi:hypothetical protein FISHEDRAFT_65185 [Fistulina hepatica ATCC 64428]|uniref:Glycosyltransferase family 32 protein n=1 Tax=Fistulina hepatica ATCC 64428 TaxID=1128425 RepID=A0A0D7AHJ7_9AGAR|nr:hypothetical protein FISHEDRAFT_65185 [Fistulina hepatica ATCC 64428]
MPTMLPTNHTSSTVEEKTKRATPWFHPVFLPIPGVRTRHLRVLVPDFSRLQQMSVSRLGRRRSRLFFFVLCTGIAFVLFSITRHIRNRHWADQWPTTSPDEPSTLVFAREDLQRIWQWEISSGHYPSRRSIPKEIGLKTSPQNPAIPPSSRKVSPSRYRPPPGVLANADTDTLGVGHKRVYLDIQSVPPDVAYPPRPVPGSVADMDIIMDHCNFSQGKYVRDCLEILRLGGGLDNGHRTRRGEMKDWKYIYVEQLSEDSMLKPFTDTVEPIPIHRPLDTGDIDPNAGLARKKGATWEKPLSLPPTPVHRPAAALTDSCDPENPRLFHMFWTGPFTDKPYLALLSFLFTQNTGIHLDKFPIDSRVCRPQFWLWINPGPAASVANPTALRDMFEELKANPWASPFLHPRFKDVIKFKLWNTTEQLDGVPELKNEWRKLSRTLFNSGGHIIEVPEEAEEAEVNSTTTKKKENEMLHRLGTTSSSTYDRLSVILSDMARFVLCHRFGGIYLDADTIFLRDWEELWGWKGAFAYRWSRLEKYNTAVLRMHKGSALGTFLFRTALRNGLDFHPMSISRYTADAYTEGLLLRLPDALFDSAWLNTEYYQRDRPPQPYFYDFGDFFDTPTQNSAAPQALGFDGFFKGAYSYHFHNFWWKPFDPSRNFPDLGPRFYAGEKTARLALKNADSKTAAGTTRAATSTVDDDDDVDSVDIDKRDLDWSTVMKRTFESYIRGERPNLYGEWIQW